MRRATSSFCYDDEYRKARIKTLHDSLAKEEGEKGSYGLVHYTMRGEEELVADVLVRSIVTNSTQDHLVKFLGLSQAWTSDYLLRFTMVWKASCLATGFVQIPNDPDHGLADDWDPGLHYNVIPVPTEIIDMRFDHHTDQTCCANRYREFDEFKQKLKASGGEIPSDTSPMASLYEELRSEEYFTLYLKSRVRAYLIRMNEQRYAGEGVDPPHHSFSLLNSSRVTKPFQSQEELTASQEQAWSLMSGYNPAKEVGKDWENCSLAVLLRNFVISATQNFFHRCFISDVKLQESYNRNNFHVCNQNPICARLWKQFSGTHQYISKVNRVIQGAPLSMAERVNYVTIPDTVLTLLEEDPMYDPFNPQSIAAARENKDLFVTSLEHVLLKSPGHLKALGLCSWDPVANWLGKDGTVLDELRSALLAPAPEPPESFYLTSVEKFYDSADILLMILSFTSNRTFFSAASVHTRWAYTARKMKQGREFALRAALSLQDTLVFKLGLWPLGLALLPEPAPKVFGTFANKAARDLQDSAYDGTRGGDVWPFFSRSVDEEDSLSVFNHASSDQHLLVTTQDSLMENNKSGCITLTLGRKPLKGAAGEDGRKSWSSLQKPRWNVSAGAWKAHKADEDFVVPPEKIDFPAKPFLSGYEPETERDKKARSDKGLCRIEVLTVKCIPLGHSGNTLWRMYKELGFVRKIFRYYGEDFFGKYPKPSTTSSSATGSTTTAGGGGSPSSSSNSKAKSSSNSNSSGGIPLYGNNKPLAKAPHTRLTDYPGRLIRFLELLPPPLVVDDHVANKWMQEVMESDLDAHDRMLKGKSKINAVLENLDINQGPGGKGTAGIAQPQLSPSQRNLLIALGVNIDPTFTQL